MNTIAIILIKGCSTRYKRTLAVFMTSLPIMLHCSNLGDTKYNISPISNCMCDTISVNREILKSLAPYSFLPKSLIKALITAANKIKMTK